MYSIENTQIKATINSKGAELCSLILQENNTEFMWSADPTFWGKTSPVLFPIVGGLRDNSYQFQGQKYNLPRHGFARDKVFEVESQTNETITFLLKSDTDSLKVYPFDFEFRIKYEVADNQLSTSYIVFNPSNKDIYFSVGGHPAFAVLIESQNSYEDYFLEFSANETLKRYPLTPEGLVIDEPIAVPQSENRIYLTKELFYEDALVFKNLKTDWVILRSDKGKHQLKFDFAGFPFLGIWAAKNADFVCIEPWCGIADAANHNQELTEKEGINRLGSGEVFERMWKVSLS
jgi:galactose mutarotase-like enzyme